MRASQGRSEAEFATLQEENTRNAASIEKYRLKLEKAKEVRRFIRTALESVLILRY